MKKKKVIYLSNISEELEVIEPIPVTIEETEDEVIAEYSEIVAYDSGTSEPEAISALKENIAWLYYDLNSTPDEKLGKAPLAWKGVLNKKIKGKK